MFCGQECGSVTVHAICLHGSSDEKANKQSRDKEWAQLNLVPMRMRGRAELPEASLILTSVKPELTVGGTLRTRTFLAPFGYEEIKIVYGEEEDQSAGRLIIPKFPKGARTEEHGPSNSKHRSEGDDGQGGSRRSEEEEPMQQIPIKLTRKTIRHRQEEYPA